MVIDTLAYTKKLEAAGVERRVAEAQAEALVEALGEHVLPDLATKTDLATTRAELEAAMARQTVQIIAIMTGIVGLFDAILFVLLRFAH